MSNIKNTSAIWKRLKKVLIGIYIIGLFIGMQLGAKNNPYENGAEIGWWLVICGVAGYVAVKIRGWISQEEARVKIWSVLSLMGGAIFALGLYKIWTLSYFRGGNTASDASIIGLLCFIAGQIGVRLSLRKK